MPQFSYEDRNIVMAEGVMYAIEEMLGNLERDLHGEFSKDVVALRDQANSFAAKLRDYNDQFEE